MTALLGGVLMLTPAPQGRRACIRARVQMRISHDAHPCPWSKLGGAEGSLPTPTRRHSRTFQMAGVCGNRNHVQLPQHSHLLAW